MNVLRAPQFTSNTHHRIAQGQQAPESTPTGPAARDTLTWGECFDQGSDAMCRNTGAIFGGVTGFAATGSLALAMAKFVPVSVEMALACAAVGAVTGAVAGAELNAEFGEKVGNWGASMANRNGYSERFGRNTARTAFAAVPWVGAAGLLLTLA